jgi:undecaprenyl diphosphate synthase
MEKNHTDWNLDASRLPRHVAIVMDGNGRWAGQRFLPRLMGHRKGVERVREITETAGEIGIQALTLYAFSDENWKRPEDEVGGLMTLLRAYVKSDRDRLVANRVEFRMLGDRSRLPDDVRELIVDLERDTAKLGGLKLNVALSYGGRGELVRAMRSIATQVQEGKVSPEQIDVDLIENHLDTAGLPQLDLLIRTSGEFRVSNFLLWQVAYAEMAFEKTLWPDFDSLAFVKVLKEFGTRERRFGMTSAQVAMDSSKSKDV